jgi:predicted outer membrane protein
MAHPASRHRSATSCGAVVFRAFCFLLFKEECIMWKKVLCVFLSVVCVACIAIAQAPAVTTDKPRDTMKSGDTATPEQMAQHWKQNVARCILLDNQGAVILNEFALEKLQNPEVRQFAQSMVKGHNEWVAKLQRFVPDAPSTDALSKRVYAIRNQIKSEKGTMPVSAETGEGARRMENMNEKDMGKHFMHMIPAMQQQMAENCLAYMQAELSNVDKDQFDKAYIGLQVFTHVADLAKLRTFENFAPADLKPIITSEINTVQSHLGEARNLCKQLDKGPNSTSRESE